MTRKELRTAAPMPRSEKVITNNPMKLYSYLVCLAGVAKYPENTRMFRQKNLVLTQIYRVTGITDKTVKLYMYYLEQNCLISYSGTHKFQSFDKQKYIKEGKLSPEYRKDLMEYTAKVWKLRKQEKDAIYYIPRPNPYTPIPEETLDRLQQDFNVTELELKLYLLCCSYRDECEYYGKTYKAITFEQLRDILGYKLDSKTDADLRRGLAFLKGINLIDYHMGYYNNSKGAKIPCFKILEVDYYIGKQLNETDWADEIISEQEREILKDRIVKGFNQDTEENLLNNFEED